jgi:DNA-binding CsgD family transcriptional regulator
MPERTISARRAQIEVELNADPNASNREIARKLGVDHKTVAAVRGQMPEPNSPVIPQSGTGEKESGEIPQTGENGGEDDWPPKRFSFWNDVADEHMIVTVQAPVKAYISDAGYLVIAQDGMANYENDQCIQISPENIETFMRSLMQIVKERRS